MFKKMIIGSFFLLMGVFSHSEEIPGDVVGNVVTRIESIGCHLSDPTCYINVTERVGLEGRCKGNSVRWFKDSVNGQEILSMFLAAQLANKTVGLYIKNDCFTGNGNYPTFGHMKVINGE